MSSFSDTTDTNLDVQCISISDTTDTNAILMCGFSRNIFGGLVTPVYSWPVSREDDRASILTFRAFSELKKISTVPMAN